MTSTVYDPEKWQQYESETERRMRIALGDELYQWLEAQTTGHDPAKEEG